MTLEFIESEHKYLLDGVPIPCISDIIAPLGEDREEEFEGRYELAADRGITCHAILASLLGKEGAEIEYPESYGPYIEGIKKFLSEHEIEPLAIEEPIYSTKLWVAGTPDLVCFFDGKLAIPDYKFVAQIAKTKVKAQLNGYRMIVEETDVEIEALYAVQFMPGGYRLYPVAIGDEEFMTCYKLWQLKNKEHKRGVIE